MPERLTGYPASPGAVTGPAARLGEPPTLPATKPPVPDPDAELTRARNALSAGVDAARQSKWLATIVRDIPIDIEPRFTTAEELLRAEAAK